MKSLIFPRSCISESGCRCGIERPTIWLYEIRFCIFFDSITFQNQSPALPVELGFSP